MNTNRSLWDSKLLKRRWESFQGNVSIKLSVKLTQINSTELMKIIFLGAHPSGIAKNILLFSLPVCPT